MDAVLTQWQEFFSKGIVPDHFLIVLSVILVTLAVANFFSSKAKSRVIIITLNFDKHLYSQ